MFVCETCGKSFDLPASVLERYPGWTPRQCLQCRDSNSGLTSSGSDLKTSTSERRSSVSKTRDLTLAEVLSTFTEGPQTGVFTDGASSGNPGPGGWGAVKVVNGEIIAEDRGSVPHTTNNRMELMAMVSGLGMVETAEEIVIYTDSKLVVDTLNSWAAGWERRGWTRKSGPIKNLELVQEAYRLVKERPRVQIKWIPAHSGYRWNEYADALATAYRRPSP